MHELPVELSAFHRRDLSLAGFLLHGRWPDSTLEWSQVLALAVRIAAVPGILATTTVFRAVDDKPAVGDSHAVGVMASAGPVLGDDAPAPGSLSQPCPPALFVLHPLRRPRHPCRRSTPPPRGSYGFQASPSWGWNIGRHGWRQGPMARSPA